MGCAPSVSHKKNKVGCVVAASINKSSADIQSQEGAIITSSEKKGSSVNTRKKSKPIKEL